MKRDEAIKLDVLVACEPQSRTYQGETIIRNTPLNVTPAGYVLHISYVES